MNDTQKKIQDARNIDFGKWMSTDTLNEIQYKLKGLIVLQNALTFTNEDMGVWKNSDLAYEVISDYLGVIADKIEELKPKLDYMDSFARVGTDELFKENHTAVALQDK